MFEIGMRISTQAPLRQAATRSAGGVGTHPGHTDMGLQTCPVRTMAPTLLIATQLLVALHSQQPSPFRSIQSWSTLHLVNVGSLRISKPPQIADSQRAPRYGSAIPMHGGHASGAGPHDQRLNSARFAELIALS